MNRLPRRPGCCLSIWALPMKHQPSGNASFRRAALLTNAPGEPSIGHEVRSELDSADQVDLLCAFVKW